ncbi:hypothetical protein ScPMuIL_003917 [Solemya velum]
MSADYQIVRDNFSSMVYKLQPMVMANFVLWLDMKVSEFKVHGKMLLSESDGDVAEWVLNPKLHMERHSQHPKKRLHLTHKENDNATDHGYSRTSESANTSMCSPAKQRKVHNVTEVLGKHVLYNKQVNVKDRLPPTDNSADTFISSSRSVQLKRTDPLVPVSLVMVQAEDSKNSCSSPSGDSSEAIVLTETESLHPEDNPIIQYPLHQQLKYQNNGSKSNELSVKVEKIDSQPSSENRKTSHPGPLLEINTDCPEYVDTCVKKQQQAKTVHQTDTLKKKESDQGANKRKPNNISSNEDFVIKVEPLEEDYDSAENLSFEETGVCSPQTEAFQEPRDTETDSNDSPRIVFHGRSKSVCTVTSDRSDKSVLHRGPRLVPTSEKHLQSTSQSNSSHSPCRMTVAKDIDIFPFDDSHKKTSSSLPHGLNFPLKVEPVDEELDFYDKSVEFGNVENKNLEPSTSESGFLQPNPNHFQSVAQGFNTEMYSDLALGDSEIYKSCLWEFLLALLQNPKKYIHYIKWTNIQKGMFKLVDPHTVAHLWGVQKNKPTMTYEKMSRSLRMYYKRGILTKVNRQAFEYQFTKWPNQHAVVKSFF